MSLLIAYLLLLYFWSFFNILPERIAPPLTIALTVGVYAAIVLLLYMKSPDGVTASAAGRYDRFYGARDFSVFAVLLAAAAVAFCFLILLLLPVAYLFVIVIYLALLLTAPILIAMAVVSALRSRRVTR
jgi:hypothetical protein